MVTDLLPPDRYLRKAQYHWGWDWGPALAPTGPYLPIYLEIYEARISNLKILPSVSETLNKATINIAADILGSTANHYLLVEIKGPNGETIQKQSFAVSNGSFKGILSVEDPELWWPHTHGKQPRYEVRLELLSAGQVYSSFRLSCLGTYAFIAGISPPDHQETRLQTPPSPSKPSKKCPRNLLHLRNQQYYYLCRRLELDTG